MRERPILFSSEMICAIIDGRKTQTRRPIHPDIASVIGDSPDYYIYRCPFGQIGDHLWVRETWRASNPVAGWVNLEYPVATHLNRIVRPSPKDYEQACRFGMHRSVTDKWSPSIHMPRWASRMLLEITDVRVERVQDITDEDARAEGVLATSGHRLHFSVLWDECYADRDIGWDDNPWVWVVVFKRIEPLGKNEAAQ